MVPIEFDLRYDVILITRGKDGELEVKEHIKDAFRPK
jgi:hypothetical protein